MAAAADDAAERTDAEAEAALLEGEATRAALDEAEAGGDDVVPDEPLSAPRPGPVAFRAPPPSASPANDAYSLRLIATRKLYDLGTTVQAAPSLAGLAPGTVVRLNPYDFDRLGVAEGTRVSLRSARTAVSLPAVADPGVPRGGAALVVNQPDARVGELVDVTEPVTDLRIETAP